METDWTVECEADDPWVAVPWSRKDETIRYIDLRAAPDRLKEIPEAAQYTAVAKALRRWNGPASPIFTAKCDVWNYGADLFDANDLPGFAFAHASYIDLLASQPEIFSDFSSCENMLRMWSARAQRIDDADRRCEWILRRARVLPADGQPLDLSGTKYIDGFATTLYVWGYGTSPQAATSAWSHALMALIEPVVLFARS